MNTPCITPERLAVYQPFSKLADEQRILLSHQLTIHSAETGGVIGQTEPHSPVACFLLTGQVRLKGKDSTEIKVSAGDTHSRQSLMDVTPEPVTITALTDTAYFTLPYALLQSLQSENIVGTSGNPALMAGTGSHPVVTELYQNLMNNKLELPTLPEVAQQISQVIVDEQLDLEKIASIISVDAALSARLLRLANSTIYRGRNSVHCLTEAISRLGLNTTRHLVLALSLKQPDTHHSPWARQQLLKNWKSSLQLGAVCYVLARQCTSIPPEEAMLAGLLHNIGELPLLTFAAHHSELRNDPEKLDRILIEARGQAGAMILHRWNLPIPLVTAVQHTDTWFYEPYNQEPTLTDILILARLHCLSAQTDDLSLPPIDQVPAFQKIQPGPMSSQMTLEILDNAREQIASVRSLLNR